MAFLIVVYISYFTWLTVRIHNSFGTFGFDMGIFEQGVWLLSRGKEPFVTILGLNLFGDHTSFILLFVVPLYWLSDATWMLFVLQSFALGIAAWPAFLIGRHKLRSEWLALGVAAAYLAHPAIAHTNLENFHPDSFEVPFVFGAVFFAIRGRWKTYAACVALLLLVKEDVPLLVFMLGIYVAVRYNRRIGILTSVISVAWFLTILFVIFPALNDVGTLDAWRLPGGGAGGAGGFFQGALTRPWELIGVALGPEKPWYLWQMFAPLALLSLLAPGMLLVAAGPLLLNLLSTFWYQYQIEYHYGTLIVPILVTAAVFGIARFSHEVRRALVAALVTAALIGGYMWGPAFGRHRRAAPDPNAPNAVALREALEVIPDDAVVSAVYYAVPHLTHREQIYEFPVPWRAANWGDFSQEGERLPFAEEVEYVLVPVEMGGDLEDIVRSLPAEGFTVIHRAGGFEVLERDL